MSLSEQKIGFDFSILADIDIDALAPEDAFMYLKMIAESGIVFDSKKAKTTGEQQKKILAEYSDIDISTANRETKLRYAKAVKEAQDLADQEEHQRLASNPYLRHYFPKIQRIGTI